MSVPGDRLEKGSGRRRLETSSSSGLTNTIVTEASSTPGSPARRYTMLSWSMSDRTADSSTPHSASANVCSSGANFVNTSSIHSCMILSKDPTFVRTRMAGQSRQTRVMEPSISPLVTCHTILLIMAHVLLNTFSQTRSSLKMSIMKS